VTFIENIRLIHHQDRSKPRAKIYLSLLERQARDMPNDCRASHYLGREYMYNGMFDKAIAEFMRHLALPNGWTAERAQSMRFMARCYRDMGNGRDAEYWYAKAVTEEPTQREAAIELSEYAAQNKEYEICAFAAKSALLCTVKTPIYLTDEKCWGALPYHLLSVGMSNKKNRDWKTASIAASIALRMEPDNENYWRNMIGLNGQSPVYPPIGEVERLTSEWNDGHNEMKLPDFGIFDHVYCIHYLKCREREARMRCEFSRIGLWGNALFTIWETIRTTWEEKYLNWDVPGVINLALQTLKILLTAKEKGYKRILIFEDDVCMLKDTGLMAEIFANTPDTDIVVYDKMPFIHPKKMADICANEKLNKWFCPWTNGIYSCSCYALNEKAIDALIKFYSQKLIPIDDAFQGSVVEGLTRSFSIINTSVQCLYSDSMFPERFGGYNTKNGYAFQGIDYTRYNVPDGYDYDKPLDPNELFK